MYKVLIVDDEPAMRFLIMSALEDEGYELLQAEDGLRAYELIQSEQPDLVIMDVMMPGMTGHELCSKVKQDAATKDILVLMLTAKAQERDRQQCKLAGADHYLSKPFSPLALLDVTANLLSGVKDNVVGDA